MVRAMRNEAAHCDFTFRFNDAGIKPLLAKIRGYKFMQELIVRYPYPMIETVPEVKREFILGHGEVLCGLGRVIMTYTPSVAAREQQWRSAK
jgi:hypothetical protein